MFYASDFSKNLQPVLTFHHFANITTNISEKFFAKMTNEENIHSRSIQK